MSPPTAAASATLAPETRDLTRLAQILAGWLAGRVPEASNIRVCNLSYPQGAGMSHETILFDAAWQEGAIRRERGLVLRIKPTRYTVFLDDMFNAQYRLMRLMRDSGLVGVAAALWFEEDATVVGAPFFVMEKVAGRVPVSYPPYSKEGWLYDATPADRQRLWEDAVRQLSLTQRVAIADADFLALPGGSNGFDQEVARWRRYIEWVDPRRELTLLRECFDRLLAISPTNRPTGVVWGDARLGNMMIGPDFRVAAVMDWEHPSRGGALHDLGWWLVSEHIQTTAQGLARLDGMGTREETIALWSAVSGKSAADIDWYEAFACLKMEMTGVRLKTLRELPANARTGAVPGTLTARFLEALA